MQVYLGESVQLDQAIAILDSNSEEASKRRSSALASTHLYRMFVNTQKTASLQATFTLPTPVGKKGNKATS